MCTPRARSRSSRPRSRRRGSGRTPAHPIEPGLGAARPEPEPQVARRPRYSRPRRGDDLHVGAAVLNARIGIARQPRRSGGRHIRTHAPIQRWLIEDAPVRDGSPRWRRARSRQHDTRAVVVTPPSPGARCSAVDQRSSQPDRAVLETTVGAKRSPDLSLRDTLLFISGRCWHAGDPTGPLREPEQLRRAHPIPRPRPGRDGARRRPGSRGPGRPGPVGARRGDRGAARAGGGRVRARGPRHPARRAPALLQPRAAQPGRPRGAGRTPCAADPHPVRAPVQRGPAHPPRRDRRAPRRSASGSTCPRPGAANPPNWPSVCCTG